MSLDLNIILGRRAPTIREEWIALYRVYRTCLHADGGVGSTEAADGFWTIMNPTSAESVWWDLMYDIAIARDDTALTFPASNVNLRPLRAAYFKRLREIAKWRRRSQCLPRLAISRGKEPYW